MSVAGTCAALPDTMHGSILVPHAAVVDCMHMHAHCRLQLYTIAKRRLKAVYRGIAVVIRRNFRNHSSSVPSAVHDFRVSCEAANSRRVCPPDSIACHVTHVISSAMKDARSRRPRICPSRVFACESLSQILQTSDHRLVRRQSCSKQIFN